MLPVPWLRRSGRSRCETCTAPDRVPGVCKVRPASDQRNAALHREGRKGAGTRGHLCVLALDLCASSSEQHSATIELAADYTDYTDLNPRNPCNLSFRLRAIALALRGLIQS